MIYIDLNNKILLFNKKSEEIFGKNVKSEFLNINSEITSFINKFKQNSSKNQEIQIKYLINNKLSILNLKFSKIYEKKRIERFDIKY